MVLVRPSMNLTAIASSRGKKSSGATAKTSVGMFVSELEYDDMLDEEFEYVEGEIAVFENKCACDEI